MPVSAQNLLCRGVAAAAGWTTAAGCVMLGGAAHALLVSEQPQRFGDGLTGLLGIDHRVDLAHFERQVRVDGGALVFGGELGRSASTSSPASLALTKSCGG